MGQDHPSGYLHSVWSGHWLLLLPYCVAPAGPLLPRRLPHRHPPGQDPRERPQHLLQEGR